MLQLIKAMKINKKVAEIIGWYGAVAIILAYALVSFGFVSAEEWIFQTLNLTGAIGIITISTIKGVKQDVVLNIFWAMIALLAITNLLINWF